MFLVSTFPDSSAINRNSHVLSAFGNREIGERQQRFSHIRFIHVRLEIDVKALGGTDPTKLTIPEYVLGYAGSTYLFRGVVTSQVSNLNSSTLVEARNRPGPFTTVRQSKHLATLGDKLQLHSPGMNVNLISIDTYTSRPSTEQTDLSIGMERWWVATKIRPHEVSLAIFRYHVLIAATTVVTF